MRRLAILLYGSAAYLLFLATFLHLVCFVQGVFVPLTLDAGGTARPAWEALLVDLGLLGLFALQHNVMARRWFKERWTRVIHPALERSTFVLASVLVTGALVWLWRPLPAVVWEVHGPGAGVLRALSWAAWGLVLAATFMIDHFELFGLKQVVRHFRGLEPLAPSFQVRFLYRWSRHPINLGFLLAFWSTPTMSLGHLLFAGLVTIWVLFSVRLEERDLVREHGEPYRQYRQRVARILPVRRRSAARFARATSVRRSDTVGA